MHNNSHLTYIAGKDDSLENAISRMKNALQSNGFNIIEHSWGNPAKNIWWVHIRDADNPQCFTNGKGSSKLAALASALGEFIERLSCNYFFADYYFGKEIANSKFVHYPNEKWFAVTDDRLDNTLAENRPQGLLTQKLAEFYDPDNELAISNLYDINSGITPRGICAIPFVCQRTNETIYFPVNIIANLYVSNGMSAGSTQAEARTQALSEIFERWVKNKIIAEEISLPTIPDNVLNRYPNIVSDIAEMTAQGYIINVFDASLGGKYPVICATLLNPHDSGCLTSFGSHPNFAVALERTITELLQGDWISDSHNLETHFIDSTGVISWKLFSSDKDYEFIDWNFGDKTSNEYQFLCDLLHNLGVDIYIADYDYLGVYACRAVVPSISEIYPIEELTQYNNNIGNSIRDTILQTSQLTNNIHAITDILKWLDNSGLDDSERLAQVLGLAIEEDNAWHSVRLGEIRCYCYLALQDFDNALDMCEWILTFSIDTMPIQKQKFFRCLKEQLTIVLDDDTISENYCDIYSQLFGKDTYSSVINHINGTETFYNLPAIDHDMKNIKNHTRWLERYRVWQNVKSCNFQTKSCIV